MKYFFMIIFILICAPTFMYGAQKTSVWIDSDPACGLGATDDVDDCWAILYAIKSGMLNIRGVSTIFGNVSVENAQRTAKNLFQMIKYEGITPPPLYKGSKYRIIKNGFIDNDATTALYNELKKHSLNIIALGPLTNIAILIQLHPEVIKNISGIIAIAGNRPSQRRFFIGNSKIIHFHDLNFKKDSKAFDLVLKSGIPLTLIPYEVATKVTITPDDLVEMSSNGESARWLSEGSQGWINFWIKQFETQGFYPFDCLAVGYPIMPNEFKCENIPTQIKWKKSKFFNRNELQVSRELGTNVRTTYCYDVSATFKKSLVFLQTE